MGLTDRLLRPLTLAFTTVAAAGAVASAAPAADAKLIRHAQGAIPNEYIVVMKQPPVALAAVDRAAVTAAMDVLALRHNAKVSRHYTSALRGFAATMSAADAAALAADPDVMFVSENAAITVSGLIQSQAIWSLDRIDQPSLPLDTRHVSLGDGDGTTVYIIDTGIRPTHLDLAGRVRPGFSAVNDGMGTTDCNGHGTHVAGTVAGTTWGVAKKALVVPVKMFDCSGNGSTATLVASIDWVLANKAPRSIANLSIVGPADAAADLAVSNLVNAGITAVVAAGNETQDACNVTPARVPNVITVAATAENDTLATFSNFGTCVDIAAPGNNVVSASHLADNGSRILSGTSMATPAVAGAAAIYLGANPTATPAQITSAIIAGAATGKVVDPKGSPNRLLNTAFLDTLPPSNKITSPADGATVATSFSLTVDVSDPNLAAVELAIDGQVLGSAQSLPVVFDIENMPLGTHLITVVATDLTGRTNSQSITVNVDPDLEPEPPSGTGDPVDTETGMPGDPSGSAPDISGGCDAGGEHDGPIAFALIALAVFGRRRLIELRV